jgi:hypothetical protein
MGRKFRFLFLSVIFLFLFYLPTSSHAEGSVTANPLERINEYMSVLVFDWVGDSGNGTVPATASGYVEGYVVMVITDPGATAPTDDYDITLTDKYGVDIMGGALADRDETNTEQAVPCLLTGVYGARFVSGTITLNISEQSDVSATGQVRIYVEN